MEGLDDKKTIKKAYKRLVEKYIKDTFKIQYGIKVIF